MSQDQIEEIECTTAKQFVDELDPSHERWAAKDEWRSYWIFRGQADANWRLVPSAFRTKSENANKQILFARSRTKSRIAESWYLHDKHTNIANFSDDLIRHLLVQLGAEITNLREFLDLANNVGLSNNLHIPANFPVFGTDFFKEYGEKLIDKSYMLDLWGNTTIAIAQHHGVATRLLDWTRNPLYAAFFASEAVKPISTHIVVYAIHTFYLRDEIRLVEVGYGHSPYIHSQEGVFTLDTHADIEFLKTGKWREILDYSIGTVYKFTLPTSEVRELARFLWLRRITKAHMMPILDNVMSALHTKWKWQFGDPDDQAQEE